MAETVGLLRFLTQARTVGSGLNFKVETNFLVVEEQRVR